MTQANGIRPGPTLLYHQGMPVAVGHALAMDRESLCLQPFPDLFPRHTRLEAEVDLPDHGRLRIPVRVAACHGDLLELAVEAVPDQLQDIL